MEIKTFSPTSHKIKAVIYGASGSGKTYFAATAPHPIFASAEGGLLSTLNHKKKIDPIKYVAITKLEDLRDLLNYLKKGDHKFETVVVDSITEINEIIKDGIEKKRGAQMQLKDWGDLAKAIKNILRGFRDLDMHVIFIAQEKTEKDDQKTEKIVPSLNGKAANEIAYFMDVVAYSFIDTMGKNKITVQPSDKLLTKARGIELPADAPEDFEEWIVAMNTINIQPEQVETVNMSAKPVAKVEDPKTQHIQPDTSKALFAEWGKFYESTGKNPENEMATLKATLKKELKIDPAKDFSTRELTEEQAKGFVDRLRKQNKLRKEEAKKKAKEQPVGTVAKIEETTGTDGSPAIEVTIETSQEQTVEDPLKSTPESANVEQQ